MKLVRVIMKNGEYLDIFAKSVSHKEVISLQGHRYKVYHPWWYRIFNKMPKLIQI